MEPQPGWDSALGLRIDELTSTRASWDTSISMNGINRRTASSTVAYGPPFLSPSAVMGQQSPPTRPLAAWPSWAWRTPPTSSVHITPDEYGLRVRPFSLVGHNRFGSSRSNGRTTENWSHADSCGCRTCPPLRSAEAEACFGRRPKEKID